MAKEKAAVLEEEEVDVDANDTGRAVESQLDRAAVIVSKYSTASAAAGLLPVPVADVAAITVVQLKMMHSLSKLYGVPFSKQLSKSLLASLSGGVAADGIGRVGLASALKMVPVVGHMASMMALPGTAFVTTSALGQILTQHYENGGTLLSLDLKVWRPIYREKVSEAAAKN